LSLLSKSSSVLSLISTLSFCLPLVLVCYSGFPLYFLFDLNNLFPEFLFDSFFCSSL
jgi:hypothetical protein